MPQIGSFCTSDHERHEVELDMRLDSLVDGDLGGDLRPEAGVLDGRDLLLGVAVHVHVQHHAAEGGAQVKGQVFVGHAAQDQVHVQLARDLVDGQVLAVQTHSGKQVQLVPKGQNQGSWMGEAYMIAQAKVLSS